MGLNRDDRKRPTARIVSDRTEFYPDDPKRPRDDRKQQKRLYGNYRRPLKTTRYEPKQSRNTFQLPVCSSRSSFFKTAASKEEINAGLFMEECQKYECLYNKFSKKDKNTKIRTKCWEKVGEKFSIDHKEANKKYEYIRSYYLSLSPSATENDKQK